MNVFFGSEIPITLAGSILGKKAESFTHHTPGQRPRAAGLPLSPQAVSLIQAVFRSCIFTPNQDWIL
jgi:hypothetical protein